MVEEKMKESQEKIKNITVEGSSGSNSVKVTINGDGEMTNIYISPETLKEDKAIIEDLIVAAHNNAKIQLKSKTSEEIEISRPGADVGCGDVGGRGSAMSLACTRSGQSLWQAGQKGPRAHTSHHS